MEVFLSVEELFIVGPLLLVQALFIGGGVVVSGVVLSWWRRCLSVEASFIGKGIVVGGGVVCQWRHCLCIDDNTN